MVVTCSVCAKSITRSNKGVNCSACRRPAHISCARISAELYKAIEQGCSDWRCSSCRCRTQLNNYIVSFDDDSTTGNAEVFAGSSVAATVSNIATDVKKELDKVSHSFLDAINTINIKIAQLETLSSTVNEHEKRINVLENDNKSLKSVVKTLTLKSDTQEQYHYANKLQNNNVPFIDGENLFDVARSIGNKLRITIVNSDISDVYRLNRRKFADRPTTSNDNSSGDVAASWKLQSQIAP